MTTTKAAPLTFRQVLKEMRKFSDRALLTARDSGWATNGRFAFEMTDEQRSCKSIVNASGTYPYKMQDMIDSHTRQTFAAAEVSNPQPIGKPSEVNGRPVIYLCDQHGEVCVDEAYHLTILRFHKGAKPYIDGDKPVIYKVREHVVGLLMPICEE